MSNSKLQIKYSGKSHIGMVRSENQDSFGKFPAQDFDLYTSKGQLFVVADGMGGHKGGKQASTIAVGAVGEKYFESAASPPEALKEAILFANKKIYETANTSAELSRMGTTCTALILSKEEGIIGHVGDSRIYRIENNKIEQLTNDHTKVQEMLREGVLTPEEAKDYPSKSVLARALGVEEKVKVDIISGIKIKEGQSFVICSDGMAKITEPEIVKIISEGSAESACGKLIDIANERGGKDNVTVQVIKVETNESVTPKVSPATSKPGSINKYILPVLLISLLLFSAYLFSDSVISFFSGTESDMAYEIQPDSLKNAVSYSSSDLNKELLLRADKYYSSGRIETALDLYKEILDDEPMNLAALQGIDKIISGYLSTAEDLMDENNFLEASELLKSILLIQPDNNKSRSLLNICENQHKYSIQSGDEFAEEENTDPALGEIIIVNQFYTGEWSFPDVPANHYTLNNNEIELSATSSKKLTLYKHQLANIEISVELSAQIKDNNSQAGIVFGYGQNSSLSGTIYFELSCSRNLFRLNKVNNNQPDHILEMKLPENAGSKSSYNLKVTCLENKIFIFSDSRLLGKWESDNPIIGQVGLSASPDMLVSFSNIYIRGLIR